MFRNSRDTKELKTSKILPDLKMLVITFFHKVLRNKNADKSFLIQPIFWAVGPC